MVVQGIWCILVAMCLTAEMASFTRRFCSYMYITCIYASMCIAVQLKSVSFDCSA